MAALNSLHQRTSCRSKPVCESHLDLLSRGTLADVTFIVGPSKERIPCHQAFLVARSPVFEVMFSERWNQDGKKEVPLHEIDPKIFRKFLQFIYSDTIVANVPEALDLLQLAHVYDVQLLVRRCVELLLEHELTVRDALDVFHAAQKYEKVELMHKAGAVMAKSLSKFQSLPSFSRLDKETLVYILKRNDVKMKEVDIFRLALRWAKNQTDLTIERALEDILPLIRFPVMSLQEFTTTVVPTGLLSQSTLVEIFTYFGTDAETKKSMARTLKFNTQRRSSSCASDSIHYVDLYSGDLTSKKTRRLQLQKFEDYLQIFTRGTRTTKMGMSGISIYCPARVASTASRPVSSTFKEFQIDVKIERKKMSGGPNHENLLCMFPVKAEEGKMTEVKFDFVVPLENNANYRICVEERPVITQPITEEYYLAKCFANIRNCYLTLKINDKSVATEGMRRNVEEQSPCEDYEHPQMICRFSLQEL